MPITRLKKRKKYPDLRVGRKRDRAEYQSWKDRNKPRSEYGAGQHPNSRKNLLPPMQKGEKGRGGGRPKGSGGGSIVKFMRDRLKEAATVEDYKCLGDQIGETLLRMARRKNLGAIQTVIEKTESKQITEDDMNSQIERVFQVVSKHVTDKSVLANIAKELKLSGV